MVLLGNFLITHVHTGNQSDGPSGGENLNNSGALMSIGEKSILDPPLPDNNEVALLIVTATVGMIGNLGILVVILVLSSLRRASNAFLFHQSALDLVKSAYCLPFARTIVNHNPPSFCSLMGGSYIVFVTTSAFNLLGIVMNESYQFADLMIGIKDSRNYCCVIFGIFMIWFSSIIMNLGVAFIPGNPSFDREKGNCIFAYGILRNYVLHMLWIVLITMALILTSVYLRMLHRDIKRSSYYRMTTLVRATVLIDINAQTASQRRQSYQREKHHVNHVVRITRKKLYLLTVLTFLFLLFWYPLFILTAIDPSFVIAPHIYKTVTIVAWCNPSVTPIILFFFIKTVCCCHDSDYATNVLNQDAVTDDQGCINVTDDVTARIEHEKGKDNSADEYDDGLEDERKEIEDEHHEGNMNLRQCNKRQNQSDLANISSLSYQGLGAIGGCASLETVPMLSDHVGDSQTTNLTSIDDRSCDLDEEIVEKNTRLSSSYSPKCSTLLTVTLPEKRAYLNKCQTLDFSSKRIIDKRRSQERQMLRESKSASLWI